MMKKMTALLLAVLMLIGMTGCGETASEPAGETEGMLTLEEYLGILTTPETETTQSDLSFEMIYTLGNNDDLNAFVADVGAQVPTTYTRTVSSEGYEASLTVYYDAPSVRIELIENYQGTLNVQTFENVTLSIPLMYELYTTEDGEVDSNSYFMAVYQSGLYGWYMTNPTIFSRCVHYLIATLPSGEQLLLDYYYNEQLAEQLELMGY